MYNVCHSGIDKHCLLQASLMIVVILSSGASRHLRVLTVCVRVNIWLTPSSCDSFVTCL